MAMSQAHIFRLLKSLEKHMKNLRQKNFCTFKANIIHIFHRFRLNKILTGNNINVLESQIDNQIAKGDGESKVDITSPYTHLLHGVKNWAIIRLSLYYKVD